MPPQPQPSTPRPLTIVVCESVPTSVSGYAIAWPPTAGVVTPNIVAAIRGRSSPRSGGSALAMPAMAAAALEITRAEMRFIPATSTTEGIIVTSDSPT